MKEIKQLIKSWVMVEKLNDQSLGEKIRKWFWESHHNEK